MNFLLFSFFLFLYFYPFLLSVLPIDMFFGRFLLLRSGAFDGELNLPTSDDYVLPSVTFSVFDGELGFSDK